MLKPILRRRQVALISLLILALLPLGGCDLLIPPERPTALYQVQMDASPRDSVTVQATFTGLPAGALNLAATDRWGAADDLTAQIRWLALEGQESAALPQAAGAPTATPGGLLVRQWQVLVPAGGKLTLRYCVVPNGQDGPVPSFLNAERALLLGRSLFVVPAAWLDQPHTECQGTLAVEVIAAQDERIWSSWDLNNADQFQPASVSDLLDAALAVGGYHDFSVQAEQAAARVLVPLTEPQAEAETMAKLVAQQVAAARLLIGTSPTGEETLRALAIVSLDQTEDLQAAMPGGDVVGRATMLLRPNATLPLAEVAAQQAMRLWVGGSVRTVERWSPEAPGQAAWFNLGWSAYLTWRAQLEQGSLSAVTYWDRVRVLNNHLGTSPYLNDLSLEDASAQAVADPALWPFVREKAHLGALLWDAQASGDERAVSMLARAVRNLAEQSADQAPGTLASTAQILEALKGVSGVDWTKAERTLASATGPLDVSAVPELALWPAGVAQVVLSAEGHALVYQWMDGPSEQVAICLSGEPGRPPYDMMAALAPELYPLWDVAYLDQRGAGRSAAPGRGGYSLDALINDIEILRAGLGTERVTLIAHSWGGFEALEYARRYPERVAGLVLLAPVPSVPIIVTAGLQQLAEKGNTLPPASAAEAARLVRDGVVNAEDLLLLGDLLGQIGAYGSDLGEVSRNVEERYAQYVALSALPTGLPFQNSEVLATIVARDLLLNYALDESLPTLATPTLVLAGERDRSLPLEALQQVADRLGGELHVVPDAGHYLYVDAPQAVSQAITRFAEKIR